MPQQTQWSRFVENFPHEKSGQVKNYEEVEIFR